MRLVDVVEGEGVGRDDCREVVRSDRVCAGATSRFGLEKEGVWIIARGKRWC
jgi:hypothetical protein